MRVFIVMSLVLGACTPLRTDNACDEANPCDSGFVCAASNECVELETCELECGNGVRCLEGLCVGNVDEGERCDITNDCVVGLQCLSSLCVEVVLDAGSSPDANRADVNSLDASQIDAAAPDVVRPDAGVTDVATPDVTPQPLCDRFIDEQVLVEFTILNSASSPNATSPQFAFDGFDTRPYKAFRLDALRASENQDLIQIEIESEADLMLYVFRNDNLRCDVVARSNDTGGGVESIDFLPLANASYHVVIAPVVASDSAPVQVSTRPFVCRDNDDGHTFASQDDYDTCISFRSTGCSNRCIPNDAPNACCFFGACLESNNDEIKVEERVDLCGE